MELAVGGELFRRLSKKGGFSTDITKFYAMEIFCALSHVQELGYAYRDLKPENVMLDEDGHCKLVDFGFSTRPDANGIVRTMCGTPCYLSPEQLNGKFTNGYSKIVDWWSLGILIFELMTGLTPFCSSSSETAYEIYLKIMKVKISFPRSFDADSKDLVQSLCHADVEQRLCSPESIKKHAYWTMPWPAVKARKLVPPFTPRISDVNDRDHYFNEYQEKPQKSGAGSGDACFLSLDGF
jgi:serum/glucocorticoid-regulated kinase 2